MASSIPKDRTVEALREEWTSISALLAALSEDDWSTPSPLPGWSIKDNVAHLIGTEGMLLGKPRPDVEIDRTLHTHVRNDIGEFNEIWVESLRPESPAIVRATFDDYTAQRLAALDAMSQDEWDAESFTPAGQDSYGRFMQIRVFDCWLHEQDIRDALDRPGNEWGLPVEVTLDEMTTAMGFVVGKKSQLAAGQSVTFELTDGGVVVRTIHVDVGDRARVVDALAGEPTTTLRMPVGVMTRLCAGRVDVETVRDEVRVGGDVALGERVLANLNYTL